MVVYILRIFINFLVVNDRPRNTIYSVWHELLFYSGIPDETTIFHYRNTTRVKPKRFMNIRIMLSLQVNRRYIILRTIILFTLMSYAT